MFLPNRPQDQNCNFQIFCVGIEVSIDAVVCGYWASGMEILGANRLKLAASDILEGFGEVEGAISGHLRVKTSKDWYRCSRMVTNQYSEASTEVWLAAWPLTMSNTARGVR